jgi:hypothetical protein
MNPGELTPLKLLILWSRVRVLVDHQLRVQERNGQYKITGPLTGH